MRAAPAASRALSNASASASERADHLLASASAYFAYRVALPEVTSPPKIEPFQPLHIPGLSDLPWLGEALLCPEQGALRFSVAKSPMLRGQVMQLGERWLVQWDTLGRDTDAWLQPDDGTPPSVRLAAIDPDIDFSYDYQDLLFEPQAVE